MGIVGLGVGDAEHDADGVQVPLEFLQGDDAALEAVAQHHLQDDHRHQQPVGPADHVADVADDIVHLVRDGHVGGIGMVAEVLDDLGHMGVFG